MKKGIVVIDMLYDFAKEGGALYVKGAEDLVEKIQELTKLARHNGHVVIYANDAHTHDDPEFRLWPRHCVKGEYGAQVIDELTPKKGDLVIEKQDLGLFTNKLADQLIRDYGVDELYFTGVATNFCVKAGALGAIEKKYKTHVIVDAIEGIDLQKGNQYEALIQMGKAGVVPVYTKDVLEELIK